MFSFYNHRKRQNCAQRKANRSIKCQDIFQNNNYKSSLNATRISPITTVVNWFLVSILTNHVFPLYAFRITSCLRFPCGNHIWCITWALFCCESNLISLREPSRAVFIYNWIRCIWCNIKTINFVFFCTSRFSYSEVVSSRNMCENMRKPFIKVSQRIAGEYLLNNFTGMPQHPRFLGQISQVVTNEVASLEWLLR